MKKILYSLMVVLFTAFTFTLASCGDKDAPEGPGNGETLTINGEAQTISHFITMGGKWNSKSEEGTFTVSVVDEHNVIKYYSFYYSSPSLPKVGDEFSSMDLRLEPLGVLDSFKILYYKSGTVEVIAIDEKNQTMTINFSNLKMEEGADSIVFDGITIVDFDFLPY